MKEKRILDLGTGTGGPYLATINTKEVDYYCVDNQIEDLRIVEERYSSTLVVRASGQDLPFRKETFDTMVILFPGGSLLAPGLQSRVPFPPEMRHESINRSGVSWYEEFARVLKPQGQLFIYGDWMLLADDIIFEKKYSPFFTFKEKRALLGEDLSSLGTSASRQTIMRRAKNLESPAYRLTFQKC